MAIPSAMKYVMVLVLECQLIIGKVGKEEGGLKEFELDRPPERQADSHEFLSENLLGPPLSSA